jgi:hypothetical protein
VGWCVLVRFWRLLCVEVVTTSLQNYRRLCLRWLGTRRWSFCFSRSNHSCPSPFKGQIYDDIKVCLLTKPFSILQFGSEYPDFTPIT